MDEGSERESTVRELHKPSAFINLATTFLYMTNYYIVGPTSAEVRVVYECKLPMRVTHVWWCAVERNWGGDGGAARV